MFRRSLALVTAARTLIENKFLDACLADAATPRLSDRLPDGGGKGERHTSLQQPNDGAESPEVTENLRRQCKGEGEVESCLEKNCQRISNSWKSLNTPVALRLQHSSIVPSNMYYDALLSSPPPKKPLQLRSSTNFQDCGIKLSQIKPVRSQELEHKCNSCTSKRLTAQCPKAILNTTCQGKCDLFDTSVVSLVPAWWSQLKSSRKSCGGGQSEKRRT